MHKAIEEKLGIARTGATVGLGSKDAPRLWKLRKETADKKYLATLVAYNRVDVANMVELLGHALSRLSHDPEPVLSVARHKYG